MWVKLKKCKKVIEFEIDEDQRFVWDVSRRRILHENSMVSDLL